MLCKNKIKAPGKNAVLFFSLVIACLFADVSCATPLNRMEFQNTSLKILLWDLDASDYDSNPNTHKRLKNISSQLVSEGEQSDPFHLVLLTSTYQNYLSQGEFKKRFSKLYPQVSKSFNNDDGLVWASSDNRLKTHQRISTSSGDSQAGMKRGGELFLFGVGEVNLYLLVMHFSPDNQKEKSYISCSSIYCKKLAILNAYEEVLKIREEDRLENSRKSYIVVVTQNLGKTARNQFMEDSDLRFGGRLAAIHTSHEHYLHERHGHLDPEKWPNNFMPSENRLADRIVRKYHLYSTFLAQTVDVFIDEQERDDLDALLQVKKQESFVHTSWTWKNPVKYTLASYMLLDLCKKLYIFECWREMESYIETGQEIKELSPYEPHVLTIKLNDR